MLAERFDEVGPVKRILATAAGLAATFAVLATATLTAVAPAAAAETAAPAIVSATPSASGDLRTGDTLRVFVAIDESQGFGVVGGTASVSVNRSPITSRSALAGWFAGTSKTVTAPTSVASAATPVVAAGVVQTTTISIPASELHLGSAGVYALAVTVRVSGKSIGVARTAIAWNLTSSKPVPVAIAAPLTVPASDETFLSSKTLELDTAPGGVLTTELDNLAQSQFAIGIDPRIIASIRVLGKSAPASAIAWLSQLESLQNQTFPLEWADSDIAAGLQAGESTVLQPKSLDYAIDSSLFKAPSTNSTPTSTPTSDPNNPTLPTGAELTSFNYTMPSLSWPVENSLISADIPKMAGSGITGAILDSSNVRTSSGGSVSGGSANDSGTAIAVSDASASQYLRDAVAATTRTSSNAALTRLATTLALVSHLSGSSPRPVLLTLGRDWETADTNFSRVLDELTAHPWLGNTTLSELIASTPSTVKIASMPESDSRLARVRTMLAWERREVSFSTVASDPEALTSSRRLALLSLLSAGWFTTAQSWSDAVSKYVKDAKAIVNSVQVEKSSRITSLADQTSVPVTVSNDLDQPVTVYLEVRPTTTVISVDKDHRFESVTIAANSQRRVQIPIASLRNGTATLAATLYDSEKKRVSRTVLIRLNVQAGWETAGTTVFAILVVGIFAFGLIRNIRRRRKATKAARETDAE